MDLYDAQLLEDVHDGVAHQRKTKRKQQLQKRKHVEIENTEEKEAERSSSNKRRKILNGSHVPGPSRHALQDLTNTNATTQSSNSSNSSKYDVPRYNLRSRHKQSSNSSSTQSTLSNKSKRPSLPRQASNSKDTSNRSPSNTIDSIVAWNALSNDTKTSLSDNWLGSREWKILSNHRKMLIDHHMDGVQKLLQQQHPHTQGCQTVLLGQIKDFQRIQTDGVQILHCGSVRHWICVAKFHSYNVPMQYIASRQNTTNRILILDSAFSGNRLTPAVQIAICQLFSEWGAIDEIEYEYVSVQQQTGGVACGMFAAAFMIDLLLGNDVSTITYEQQSMRLHLSQCFINDQMTPFPRSNNSSCTFNREYVGVVPLICVCKMPECFDSCVKCTNRQCGLKYHKGCVDWNALSANQKRTWKCPKCDDRHRW